MTKFTVKNRQDAVKAVAKLLQEWSTPTAAEKLTKRAQRSKQAVETTATRAATNLLETFSLNR